MIKTSVTGLQKGDRIRFAEAGGLEYALGRDPEQSGDTALMILTFGDGIRATVSKETPVYAVSMIRVVTVPCLVHKDDVELLYDAASGASPLGVVCGDCGRETTAQVMRWMAEKKAAEGAPRPEPKVKDKVYVNGGVTAILRFDEDMGTLLASGRWVCASDFEWMSPSVWKYEPKKAS